MTVEHFLNAIEEKALLPDSLLRKLRRQIDESSKEITAESIAKLLVKKRHLTKFQAEHLLEEEAPVEEEAPAEEELIDQADIPLEPITDDQEDTSPEPEPSVPEKSPAEMSSREDDPLSVASPQSFGDDEELAPIEDSDADDHISSEESEPFGELPEDELRPLAAESGVLDAMPSDGLDELEPLPADDSFTAPTLESLGDDDTLSDEDGAIESPLMEDEFGPMTADGDELEELGDGASFDDNADAVDSPLMPAKKGDAGRFGSKKNGVPSALKKSDGDSSRLLIGGGALILLVLIGGGVWFVLKGGSGDQAFAQAEEDYQNRSYSQAINGYDEFLTDYPDHVSTSLARVRRELARLRQKMQGTSDFERSLSVANEVLGKIQYEQAFMDVQDELGSLLPDIAEGLAEQARNGSDTATVKSKISLAKQALGLVSNSTYAPNERADEIRATLALISQGIERESEMRVVLGRIRSQIANGNLRQAYTTRKQLLNTYPGLETNESLVAIAGELAQAELAGVERVDEARKSLRDDAQSPLAGSLALADLADRSGETAPRAAGRFALVRVGGAVYGLDASSGRLLWRRLVGSDHTVVPVRVDTEAGSDALLVDVNRDELVRVETKTGRMIWRYPVGERFTSPVVSGSRVLVATDSGLLHAIDLVSGESTSHLRFAQNLRVAPTAHPGGVYAYQMGEHSSLYTVSAADMRCLEVFYLGHDAGAVRVSPVFALGNVFIAENQGSSACTLHVLSADADGLSLRSVQQIDLNGHVLTPPIVFRSKLAVVTDLGEIKVFDIGTAGDPKPLTEVAQLVATGDQSMLPYTLVDRGNLWIADTRMAKYEVQFSTGEVDTQAIDQTYDGDAFDHPLQFASDVIIHVRRQQGRDDVTVSAMTVASGRPIWETHLVMPPVGETAASAAQR